MTKAEATKIALATWGPGVSLKETSGICHRGKKPSKGKCKIWMNQLSDSFTPRILIGHGDTWEEALKDAGYDS